MGVQGVQLDASSAGALHESLQALRQHEDQDLLEIMQLLVTKPMQVSLFVPCDSLATGPHRSCRHMLTLCHRSCFNPSSMLCTLLMPDLPICQPPALHHSLRDCA